MMMEFGNTATSNSNMMGHEVQLSSQTSSGGGGADMLSSYQQPPQASAAGIGPGMAKILEKQRRDQIHHRHTVGEAESMRRTTRWCYATLGFVLLIVYFVLLRKHFFEHHGIVVPSFSGTTTSSSSSSSINDDDDDEDGSSLQQQLELEGSSKKKHKKKQQKKSHADDDDADIFTKNAECDDGSYSKRTLKRAYELPFAAIFKDTKGQEKYEASDIILVDGEAYAVCDNSWAISKFGDDLTPFSPGNKQIGDPNREDGEDSGYEALFHDDGTFYVLRESVLHEEEGEYHAIIEELSMTEDDYEVQMACSSEFAFEGDSKGFEGVLKLHDTSNELVVLGLCEGNHCSQSQKFDTGHGEFVVMKKTVAPDGSSCEWSTIRKLKIPSSANFKDYSAATIDETGRVAISSQEDSAIWVGQLLGRDDATGLWDLDNLEFDEAKGDIFSFPKSDDCETIYCNIEGIHWINHEMIIAVSDKMKSKGKQDFRCFEKDQSVHVFVLP